MCIYVRDIVQNCSTRPAFAQHVFQLVAMHDSLIVCSRLHISSQSVITAIVAHTRSGRNRCL